MTLDEHIKKAEEDAVQAESDSDWGFGNYFIDRTEALEYAENCRQLAEWLKDYKRLLEQEPCEDWRDVPSDEMNIEQAKQAVRDLRKFIVDNHISPKLQYCEDAISRQAVNKLVDELARAISDERYYIPQRGRSIGNIMQDILDLPSVTLQPKTGYWIEDENEMKVRCSECGDDNDNYSKFCPNCGVKMVEPQESEEKE